MRDPRCLIGWHRYERHGFRNHKRIIWWVDRCRCGKERLRFRAYVKDRGLGTHDR